MRNRGDHWALPVGTDDAGAAQCPHDQHADPAAHLVLFARQRARHHPQIDGVQLDAFHAHQLRRIQEQILQRGVLDRLFRHLVQHVVDGVEIGRRRHRDVDDRPRPVLRQVQRLDDLPVGDGEHLTLGGPQLGDPQRDVLDRALRRRRDAGDRQRHQITEAVLLLGDDEEPGEQVLHDALRAETERGAEHRGRCDQRSHRDREDRR